MASSLKTSVWFHPQSWALYQCKCNIFPVCLRRIFLVCNMFCSCKNKLSSFCFICSKAVLKSQRKPLSKLIRKTYELYFGSKVRDQHKVWALLICCSSCSRTWEGWLKGTDTSMLFGVQIVWHDPQDHRNNCYFCMTKMTGFSRFSKCKIEYSNIPCALKICFSWWFNASAQATEILYSWLRIRRDVTRRCKIQHEWRPRLFSMWYCRATCDHSGRINWFS